MHAYSYSMHAYGMHISLSVTRPGLAGTSGSCFTLSKVMCMVSHCTNACMQLTSILYRWKIFLFNFQIGALWQPLETLADDVLLRYSRHCRFSIVDTKEVFLGFLALILSSLSYPRVCHGYLYYKRLHSNGCACTQYGDYLWLQ